MKNTLRAFQRSVAAITFLAGSLMHAAEHAKHPVPLNEEETTIAWKALKAKHYQDAVVSADKVIRQFQARAESTQSDLQNKSAPEPSTTPGRAETKEILSRGPLNDVATCFYIKGQALDALADTAGAKEAYQGACKLTYARTWDPHGWFWSASQKSCELVGNFPKGRDR